MSLSDNAMFCRGGCGRILTLEQMHTIGLCEFCGKKHAETFPERFQELGEEKEDNE